MMNERIQELAEQAEQYADDTMNSDPAKYDRPGQVKVWRELMQAKFAELIVKDFQKLIKDTYLNTAPEHRDCLLMLDARVEEHFGVEE